MVVLLLRIIPLVDQPVSTALLVLLLDMIEIQQLNITILEDTKQMLLYTVMDQEHSSTHFLITHLLVVFLGTRGMLLYMMEIVKQTGTQQIFQTILPVVKALTLRG